MLVVSDGSKNNNKVVSREKLGNIRHINVFLMFGKTNTVFQV